MSNVRALKQVDDCGRLRTAPSTAAHAESSRSFLDIVLFRAGGRLESRFSSEVSRSRGLQEEQLVLQGPFGPPCCAGQSVTQSRRLGRRHLELRSHATHPAKSTSAQFWAARSQPPTQMPQRSEQHGRVLPGVKELVAPARVAEHNHASCFEQGQSSSFGKPQNKHQVRAIIHIRLRQVLPMPERAKLSIKQRPNPNGTYFGCSAPGNSRKCLKASGGG